MSCIYTAQGELVCPATKTGIVMERFDSSAAPNKKQGVTEVLASLIKNENTCGINIMTQGDDIEKISVTTCQQQQKTLTT